MAGGHRSNQMNLPTQIVLWALDKLLPYARNSRTHSAEQIAQVAASIREFGWTSPILVDGQGVIIAGHARLLAARQKRPAPNRNRAVGNFCAR